MNRSRLRGLRKRAGHFGEKAAAPLLPVEMNECIASGIVTVRTLAACHKPCASVVTSSGRLQKSFPERITSTCAVIGPASHSLRPEASSKESAIAKDAPFFMLNTTYNMFNIGG